MDVGMKLDPYLALSQAEAKTGVKKGESAEKAAEQFESFLIFSLLKECERATCLTKKGYADEVQMSIFYEKIADFMAKKGIGIKQMIARYAEAGSKVSGVKGEKSSQEVSREDR